MNLIFVTEARFVKDKNENIYGDTSFNHELWNRYLTVFDHIYVMARVEFNNVFDGKDENLCSSEKVTFIELPYYVGPIQYLKYRHKIKEKIDESIKSIEGKYICRVPGNISNIVIKKLIKNRIEYGVEVVGDPWEVFAPGTIQHPLRSYFRFKGFYDLKINVRNAIAVLYVTKKELQKRYPASKLAFQTNASNVRIEDHLIAKQPKKHLLKHEYNVLSIGSLEQMYKSPDVVLKALKALNDNSINCNLIWLGDGVFKSKMKVLSQELGISHRVEFKGNISSKEVRRYLNEADIFVLASRTEGLPRAVIEAMSSGLPCVGTAVGGIPELLSPEVLVPKNNSNELFKIIKKTLTEPEFYNEQARINLDEAHTYRESVLQQKRNLFYTFLLNFHN